MSPASRLSSPDLVEELQVDATFSTSSHDAFVRNLTAHHVQTLPGRPELAGPRHEDVLRRQVVDEGQYQSPAWRVVDVLSERPSEMNGYMSTTGALARRRSAPDEDLDQADRSVELPSLRTKPLGQSRQSIRVDPVPRTERSLPGLSVNRSKNFRTRGIRKNCQSTYFRNRRIMKKTLVRS